MLSVKSESDGFASFLVLVRRLSTFWLLILPPLLPDLPGYSKEVEKAVTGTLSKVVDKYDTYQQKHSAFHRPKQFKNSN
jgi:hypothetical protein